MNSYMNTIDKGKEITAELESIQISHLAKQFGDGPVILDDINLDILQGDFVAIIGPSGCGKSTLLKLIANLITPSSGAINIVKKEHSETVKMGFVFQDANLLPWANIQDNVSLPLKLAGISKQRQAVLAEEMLALVNLSGSAKLYPRELSGGMRMRVSIARALATEPALLLLDEPFGALDEMTRDDLNEELLQLRESQGWTGIFVTHSVTEAVFLANKVLVLAANPGKVHKIIEVDMPYPRTAEMRAQEVFQKKVAEVTSCLHSVRKPGSAGE